MRLKDACCKRPELCSVSVCIAIHPNCASRCLPSFGTRGTHGSTCVSYSPANGSLLSSSVTPVFWLIGVVACACVLFGGVDGSRSGCAGAGQCGHPAYVREAMGGALVRHPLHSQDGGPRRLLGHANGVPVLCHAHRTPSAQDASGVRGLCEHIAAAAGLSAPQNAGRMATVFEASLGGCIEWLVDSTGTRDKSWPCILWSARIHVCHRLAMKEERLLLMRSVPNQAKLISRTG